MHPVERLRFVARAGVDAPSLLVREAAGALASFGSDPAALVTACRRLVARQHTTGTVWTIASRVLTTMDAADAWDIADEIEDDPTPRHLVDCLPDDARLLVLGWPELLAPVLSRRGDLHVLVVDVLGAGEAFVRALDRAGVEAELVEERGLGAAAQAADLVVIDAVAMGGEAGSVAAIGGSLAAASVARLSGRATWAVVGAGRALPPELWNAYEAALELGDAPWDGDLEILALDLVDYVVGPDGLAAAADVRSRADCLTAVELCKPI